MLAEAGVDPTFVIGGRLNAAGANSRLGAGDYIVVEADESDASFLNLLPVMAVVTNIDADHMDTYGHDFAKLKQAFVEFIHRMPFYGAAILCADDAGVRSIMPMISRPIVSYGFGADAMVRAVDVEAHAGTMRFTVQRRNGVRMPDLQVTLNLPGDHNVLNALAAIAVADRARAARRARSSRAWPSSTASAAASSATASSRCAGGGSFTLIDDYGHHPVEMAATLAAARGAFPGRRLVLAFQPHRYTRTRDCFEDFVKVIGSADAGAARRGLRRRRGADRRRRRPLAGARAARRRQGRPGVRRRHRRHGRQPIVEQAQRGRRRHRDGRRLDRHGAGAGRRAGWEEHAA